jgi:hypothetical protein
MPKPVDDMVDSMLADKSFYPKKSKDDRESTAWAIAYSQYNKSRKNKKSSVQHSAVRKAELNQLHRDITLLENNNKHKEAEILNSKFTRLAQTSSNVLKIEPVGSEYQILLNGNLPYKDMNTQSPIMFDTYEEAMNYAKKLAGSEDFMLID